jgi:hypothetical protein
VDNETASRGYRSQPKLCKQDGKNKYNRKETDHFFCHDLLRKKKAYCLTAQSYGIKNELQALAETNPRPGAANPNSLVKDPALVNRYGLRTFK